VTLDDEPDVNFKVLLDFFHGCERACSVLLVQLLTRVSESKFHYLVAVKQTVVTDCYCVVRQYVVRQVSSAVQESLRRLGISWNTATQLEKWTTEEVRAVILFLWLQNAKPVNIHRQVVAVYGTNVIPVEQMRK
jgi:hypothetical protein